MQRIKMLLQSHKESSDIKSQVLKCVPQAVNIEGILNGGAKIKILFPSGKTTFYKRALRVRKILFKYCKYWKIHTFKPPRSVLFIIDKKTPII